MPKDYYEILGVRKTASIDEIKRAYREQVLKYHPDVNKDPKAEVRMRELNEAYAVLSDEQKRQQYDAFGPEQFGQQYSPEDIFRGFNPEDLFKDIFGFSNFGQYGDMFGMEQENEMTGLNLYFPFDELERGVEKDFEVRHYKKCQNCRGSGGEPGSQQIRCPKCDGTGNRFTQQNTIFGRIQMHITCDKCGGRGRVFEKECTACKGKGRVVVTDKFRVKAEKLNKEGEEPKKKRGFF